MLIFSIIFFILAAVAAVSGLCYRMAFHVPPRKPMPEDHIPLGIIHIGYPLETPEPRDQYDPDRVHFVE